MCFVFLRASTYLLTKMITFTMTGVISQPEKSRFRNPSKIFYLLFQTFNILYNYHKYYNSKNVSFTSNYRSAIGMIRFESCHTRLLRAFVYERKMTPCFSRGFKFTLWFPAFDGSWNDLMPHQKSNKMWLYSIVRYFHHSTTR